MQFIFCLGHIWEHFVMKACSHDYSIFASNYLAPENTPTPLTAPFEQGFGTEIACTTHSSGTSIVGSVSKLDLLP